MTHRRLTFVPKRLAWRSAAGFTLVEMAVVITLMAIFMTMGLRLLQATRDTAAWTETKAKQERIKLAFIGYLRSNGTLPCPDATAVGTAPTGVKGTSPCLGALGSGVVPWKDLGLSVADVQDGWSNFFTYRVANRTPASSSNWTTKLAAENAFSINELTVPLTTFSLKERDAAGVLSATALTPNPVLVLVSHGKNGSGARTIGGTRLAMPTGADEIVNATVPSRAFINRAPNDVATSAGGLFDDIVVYMTPQDLLQPLVDDKTLKGSSVTYYREQSMQQVALASCTPPSVAPSLLAIAPNVGNGDITYSCPASATYSCRSATAMSYASTPLTQLLYRLAVFGSAAVDVTYGQLLAAFPGIAARCP